MIFAATYPLAPVTVWELGRVLDGVNCLLPYNRIIYATHHRFPDWYKGKRAKNHLGSHEVSSERDTQTQLERSRRALGFFHTYPNTLFNSYGGAATKVAEQKCIATSIPNPYRYVFQKGIESYL